MTLVWADRVQETTTSTGTGDLALGGAVSGGYVTFASKLANADTCYYACVDAGNSAWEVGLGTFNSGANSLTRTTVLASSNAGALVSFTSASKSVFITAPASFLGSMGGGSGISQLTGDATAGPGSGSQAVTLATVNASPGTYALATVTVNAKGLVTTAAAAATTGSGNVVLASSPTIVTPTIASFANANHDHTNAAGGGALTTVFASPPALGATTAAAVTASVLSVIGAADVVQALVKGNASQTANLLQLQNSGGSVLLRVTKDGYLGIGVTTPNAGVDVGTLYLYGKGAVVDRSDGLTWKNGATQTGSLWADGALGANGATVGFVGAQWKVTTSDAATATVADALVAGHNSSGTPAANYGTGVRVQGHSSTNTVRDLARLRAIWVTATDASRAARVILSAWDSGGERDGVAVEGSGTVAKLGFYGATPVIQPATTGTTTGFTTGAGTAVKDDSTFTGGTGSTAYRISDIVLALKQLGLLAA